MRTLGLGMVALGLAVIATAGAGCDGCDNNPKIVHLDLAGSGDMAVPELPDLAHADQAVPLDMTMGGNPDMIHDMTVPLDAQEIVDVPTLIQNLAAAFCSRMLRCGQVDTSRMDACIELEKTRLVQVIDLQTEVMKGRIVINDAVCKAFIASGRCDDTDHGHIFESGPCGNGLFTGKQMTNDSCLASIECAGGFCQHGDAGAENQGCTGGGCQPLRNATSTDKRCAPEFFTSGSECDPTKAGCQANPNVADVTNRDGGACVAMPAAGANCLEEYPGSGQFVLCATGMFCGVGAGGEAKCTVPPATPAGMGMPCDDFQEDSDIPPCADGLYCKHVGPGYDYFSPGVCTTKVTSGSVCDPLEVYTFGGGRPDKSPCVDGTACYAIVEDNNAGTNRCRPLGTPVALGACPNTNPDCHHCDPNDATGFGVVAGLNLAHCQATLYCKPTGDTAHPGNCDSMAFAGGATLADRNCKADKLCLTNYLNVASHEFCTVTAGVDGGTCTSIKNPGDPCVVGVDTTETCFGSGTGAVSSACTGVPARCQLVCP